ncbi:hypothetical protein Q5P01_017842 [Channa striata]|uniref:EGF-like domain-containing protein n=1 Tax=Channa striata TaxID=64152 RepID=A0AA88MAF5_CHASR|nr:hypothetical protein Q5P01_017842 [Channa striata]
MIRKIDTKNSSDVMKSLYNFANLASSTSALVSSIINVVEITGKTPLREGFAELDRKLDSLSMQVSNLATDVEWFNYASVYSQDEVCILNAWKKFCQFFERSELIQSEEDKVRLAEIFTNYYENTAVEACVANLYHYLMVISSTSLSGNLNNLLKKKYKCDISEIGKYNLYFSSLLWKGLVLNELYWNLIGFDLSAKEVEQTQMFRNVYKAQISAVDFCLNNYEQYMKEDVMEITKALSPDNKTAIADQVKKALDEKYDWYNWVVLVYDTQSDENYIMFDLTKIHVDTLTVAVGYTLKGGETDKEVVIKAATKCFEGRQCQIIDKSHECSYNWYNDSNHRLSTIKLTEYAKAIHVIYGEKFVEIPKASHQVECRQGWRYSTSKILMHYSRNEPVCVNTCKNGGKCMRLLDSNEWLCECPDGYYGDRCEEKIEISKTLLSDTHNHVPDITTIDNKLKRMEAKLEDILILINETCPQTSPALTYETNEPGFNPRAENQRYILTQSPPDMACRGRLFLLLSSSLLLCSLSASPPSNQQESHRLQKRGTGAKRALNAAEYAINIVSAWWRKSKNAAKNWSVLELLISQTCSSPYRALDSEQTPEKYMKEDVAEIAKALSPDNKQTIADEVKKALDQKYNWYKWVVLVYDTSKENMMNLDMTTVIAGKITVAVGYTVLDQTPTRLLSTVMAFLLRSDVMRFVSLMLLLLWTTSSAQSHDPTFHEFSAPHGISRSIRQVPPLPPGTREKVKETLDTVKESLTVVKDVLTAKDVLKKCAKFASVAPGCVGAIFSLVNLVFAFLPQEDPVQTELREGFAEVNRKLDLLSIQISNLATDVEWFNYASVYSQDEVRILNAWKKFSEFFEKSGQTLRQAEIFTNYYEYTGTEASVSNLYHYLTVSSTSLSGNLNDLLRKKFKCDVKEIGKYNLYFSSLLLKGVILNEFYWKLIGFKSSDRESEHAQMFKNVFEAQTSSVEFCQTNYEQYMKKDVKEIAKDLSPDDKQTIAVQVKEALDEKYNWFHWVVLVYDTDQDGQYFPVNMYKVPMGKVIVAVGSTLKVKRIEAEQQVKRRASECSVNRQCEEISNKLAQCYLFPETASNYGAVHHDQRHVNELAKVMYTSCHEGHSSQPEPLHKVQCIGASRWSTCHAYIYYSQRDVCEHTCHNGGKCKVLLNSNEWFCECPEGYHGDRCEAKMETPTIRYPMPSIVTTNSKLTMIESKLEEILRTVSSSCRETGHRFSYKVWTLNPSGVEQVPDTAADRIISKNGTHNNKTTDAENSSKPETFRLAHDFSLHR